MSNQLVCSKCHTVFTPFKNTISSLCITCATESDTDYQKVRSFLKDNPKKTPVEIANETGVNLAKILGYVKNNMFDSK